MTKDEFLNYTAKEIRNSTELMIGYIELFSKEFSREPDCAPCTIRSDYYKLKNHLTSPKKNKKMSNNKYKISPEHQNEIIRVNGIAVYLKNATNEQLDDYLSEKGKSVNLEARKEKVKLIKKEVDLSDLKVSELKKLAEKKGIEDFDSMKKNDLVNALS